nr:MAG TPA: hypothetical protein [Caudoviricetes sp.]
MAPYFLFCPIILVCYRYKRCVPNLGLLLLNEKGTNLLLLLSSQQIRYNFLPNIQRSLKGGKTKCVNTIVGST